MRKIYRTPYTRGVTLNAEETILGVSDNTDMGNGGNSSGNTDDGFEAETKQTGIWRWSINDD